MSYSNELGDGSLIAYGMLDECHMCICYCDVQESFQWIKITSYAIYTPISSIICGFACFERFYRIQVYNPKSQDWKIFFRAIGSKKIAKEAQNDPTQAKLAVQKMHQNKAFEEQTRRAVHRPPQPVVEATAVVARYSTGYFGFFCGLSFSRAFFLFVL